MQKDTKYLMELVEKLAREHELKEEELLELTQDLPDEVFELLGKRAKEQRDKLYQNRIFVRGLIELTNFCKKDCAYCGIRKSNRDVERYRLTKETVLASCEEGYRLGFRTFVMQGGEDPYFTDERLTDILSTIRAKWPDTAITLSIGERSTESYKALFEAGADRFLLRHETACEELYRSIHPDSEFHERRACLKALKEVGFQTGAGFMVGIPGQKPEDFVKDLLFLKELKPHMVGIGPFIPHKDTPLGNYPAGSVRTVLQMLGLTRLLLPEVLLPATTALGTLDPLGREKGFEFGANVIMPNLTPNIEKFKYNLYEGKPKADDKPEEIMEKFKKKVEAAGYVLDMSRGDHVTWVDNRKDGN